MAEQLIDIAARWLLTYMVHSTLLIGLVWTLVRSGLPRCDATREMLWRVALVGGVVTASVQTTVGLEPMAGTLDLPARPAPAPPALVLDDLDDLAALPPLEDMPGALDVAAPEPTRSLARPEAVATALPAIALALVAMGAAVAIGRRLRLAICLSRRAPVACAAVTSAFDDLTRRAGVGRRVALTQSDALAVPVAFGWIRPEICLPSRALETLGPRELRCVLAHELAHVIRRDPLWMTVTQLLCGALFLQPLNGIVRRRLHELAEFACDRWAAEATGDGVALARCLTRIADWLVGPAALRTASAHAAMAGRPSALAARVGRLLQPAPAAPAPARRRLTAIATLVLVAASLVAPGIGAASARPAGPGDPPFLALDAELILLAREMQHLQDAARGAGLPPDFLARLDDLARRASAMRAERDRLARTHELD